MARFDNVLKLATVGGRKKKPKRKKKVKASPQSRYNPDVQKPTKLGKHHYHSRRLAYYGPPPDMGTSYGRYACASCWASGKKLTVVSVADKVKKHCPACGKDLKIVGKISAEKWQTMLKSFEDRIVSLPACGKCGTQHVSSAAKTKGKTMTKHCVSCGGKMGAAATSEYFETLTPIEAFKDVELTEADVNMIIFDENGEDPFWNLDVRGRPVAQIRLSDQPNPDEIRDLFVAPNYREGVAGAIERTSLNEVLTQLRARPWTSVVDQADFAQKVHAKADDRIESEVVTLFDEYKSMLLECVGLVCSGMDKNFYKDIGNPLKESLFAEMKRWGVSDDTAVEVIEAAFEEGATSYFETVLKQATEYMVLPKEALAEIEKAITGANTIATTDVRAYADDDHQSMAHRMAANSVPVTEVPQEPSSKAENIKNRLKTIFKRLR